jgi:hypothetical protein
VSLDDLNFECVSTLRETIRASRSRDNERRLNVEGLKSGECSAIFNDNL